MVEPKTNMDEKKKTGEQELSASSSTPPCIDRLRKSYLVHFCKKSLHSVAEKGEKRCPKCRQLIRCLSRTRASID